MYYWVPRARYYRYRDNLQAMKWGLKGYFYEWEAIQDAWDSYLDCELVYIPEWDGPYRWQDHVDYED